MAKFIFQDDSVNPEISKVIVAKISDSVTLHMKGSYCPLVFLSIEECEKLVDDVMAILVDEFVDELNDKSTTTTVEYMPLISTERDPVLIFAKQVATIMKMYGFSLDDAMLIANMGTEKEGE